MVLTAEPDVGCSGASATFAFVGCVSGLGRGGTILKLVALADVWASTCTVRRHFVAHAPGG